MHAQKQIISSPPSRQRRLHYVDLTRLDRFIEQKLRSPAASSSLAASSLQSESDKNLQAADYPKANSSEDAGCGLLVGSSPAIAEPSGSGSSDGKQDPGGRRVLKHRRRITFVRRIGLAKRRLVGRLRRAAAGCLGHQYVECDGSLEERDDAPVASSGEVLPMQELAAQQEQKCNNANAASSTATVITAGTMSDCSSSNTTWQLGSAATPRTGTTAPVGLTLQLAANSELGPVERFLRQKLRERRRHRARQNEVSEADASARFMSTSSHKTSSATARTDSSFETLDLRPTSPSSPALLTTSVTLPPSLPSDGQQFRGNAAAIPASATSSATGLRPTESLNKNDVIGEDREKTQGKIQGRSKCKESSFDVTLNPSQFGRDKAASASTWQQNEENEIHGHQRSSGCENSHRRRGRNRILNEAPRQKPKEDKISLLIAEETSVATPPPLPSPLSVASLQSTKTPVPTRRAQNLLERKARESVSKSQLGGETRSCSQSERNRYSGRSDSRSCRENGGSSRPESKGHDHTKRGIGIGPGSNYKLGAKNESGSGLANGSNSEGLTWDEDGRFSEIKSMNGNDGCEEGTKSSASRSIKGNRRKDDCVPSRCEIGVRQGKKEGSIISVVQRGGSTGANREHRFAYVQQVYDDNGDNEIGGEVAANSGRSCNGQSRRQQSVLQLYHSECNHLEDQCGDVTKAQQSSLQSSVPPLPSPHSRSLTMSRVSMLVTENAPTREIATQPRSPRCRGRQYQDDLHKDQTQTGHRDLNGVNDATSKTDSVEFSRNPCRKDSWLGARSRGGRSEHSDSHSAALSSKKNAAPCNRDDIKENAQYSGEREIRTIGGGRKTGASASNHELGGYPIRWNREDFKDQGFKFESEGGWPESQNQQGGSQQFPDDKTVTSSVRNELPLPRFKPGSMTTHSARSPSSDKSRKSQRRSSEQRSSQRQSSQGRSSQQRSTGSEKSKRVTSKADKPRASRADNQRQSKTKSSPRRSSSRSVSATSSRTSRADNRRQSKTKSSPRRSSSRSVSPTSSRTSQADNRRQSKTKSSPRRSSSRSASPSSSRGKSTESRKSKKSEKFKRVNNPSILTMDNKTKYTMTSEEGVAWSDDLDTMKAKEEQLLRQGAKDPLIVDALPEDPIADPPRSIALRKFIEYPLHPVMTYKTNKKGELHYSVVQLCQTCRKEVCTQCHRSLCAFCTGITCRECRMLLHQVIEISKLDGPRNQVAVHSQTERQNQQPYCHACEKPLCLTCIDNLAMILPINERCIQHSTSGGAYQNVCPWCGRTICRECRRSSCFACTKAFECACKSNCPCDQGTIQSRPA